MTQVISKAADRRMCAECGTSIPDHAPRCWLCGRLAALAHPSSRSTPWRLGDSFRFQLHSMFLTTALLSVCLGVARHWPSLAMSLVVPLATAYLRTVQIALDFGASGRPLGIGSKITLYVRSLGVTLLIFAGASATLIVSIGIGVGVGMLAGQWLEDPMYAPVGFAVGTSLGVFGALAVAAWTGSRVWPGPRLPHDVAE